MVVENDVNCIVMVTGLVEQGKKKCEDYFDSTIKSNINSTGEKVNPGFTHNNIYFTLTEKKNEDVYEERTFSYLKDGETKTVTHLWFKKWPDHGVPVEGDFMVLLQRFNELKKKKLKKASPETFKPLVHCSAGVGRTGTFIVLDHILYDETGNPRVDLVLNTDKKKLDLIDDTICQLRQQRNNLMVQTKVQYKFIYNVIKENEEEEPLPPPPKKTNNSPVKITNASQVGGRKSKTNAKTRTQKRRSTNPKNKRTRKSKK